MSNSLHVELITARRKIISTLAEDVLLPGHDGEVGILPQHEHYIGKLGIGTLRITTHGKSRWFAISHGVYEVSGSNLVILARQGVEGETVDEDEVRTKLAKAEKELQTMSFHDDNYSQLAEQTAYFRAGLQAYGLSAASKRHH